MLKRGPEPPKITPGGRGGLQTGQSMHRGIPAGQGSMQTVSAGEHLEWGGECLCHGPFARLTAFPTARSCTRRALENACVTARSPAGPLTRLPAQVPDDARSRARASACPPARSPTARPRAHCPPTARPRACASGCGGSRQGQ